MSPANLNHRSKQVARCIGRVGVVTLTGLATLLGSPGVAEIGDPNRPGDDDWKHDARDIGREQRWQAPTVAASGACDAFHEAIVDREGDALVELIRTTDISCIRALERGPSADIQAAAARERNVLAVAKGVEDALEDYAGGYGAGVRRLLVFLLAVEDIRAWCLLRGRQSGGTCDHDVWDDREAWSIAPGSDAYEAVAEALDAFLVHDRFGDANREHADVLSEYARTIYVYEQNARHLDVVVYWLSRWGDRYAEEAAFQRFAGRMMHILYQGHRLTDFDRAFGEDRELADALHDCAMRRDWLGTQSQWLAQRCGSETGRFAKYKGTSNYVYGRILIWSLRSEYEQDDEGWIWLRVLVEVDYYDRRNCHFYGVCHWYAGDGFEANVRAAVFAEQLECPTNHCPLDRITVHAQALGDDKLALACERLDAHGKVFHDLFHTDCEPVADDFNNHLDIFVFHDVSSCKDLSEAAFWPYVDACSGIYFEMDPTDAATRPFFIATEYEARENPRDPHLAIWNFEHEYGHYLDGRYNLHGGYNGELDSIHWWTEGFAEYFAAEVSPYIDPPSFDSPHTLSEIVLHSDSLRTRYRHRHLAVRYFLQNDGDFVDTILGHMRRGDYDAYQAFLEGQVAAHEDPWMAWLDSGGQPANPGDSEDPDHLIAIFPSASDALGREGFARVVNHSDEERTVGIVAVDDRGRRSEPLTLAIDPKQTVHFNSDDLEDGNPQKGLTGGAGAGNGDWRLELTSALDVDVLAYIRTEDGLLASMHDTVRRDGHIHRVPIFNPGSNRNQKSLLRVVNLGDGEASVEIRGTDDQGEPGGPVVANLLVGEARTFSAEELEAGGGDVEGSLGDGFGKWRLEVESAQPLVVVSLMSTPTGHMTNLSTEPALLE